MRRFATFVLLGPLLAWLTMFMLLLPKFVNDPDSDAFAFMLTAIVITVVICFIPSAILAGIDHLMAERGTSRAARAILCAVLGYAAAVLAFYMATEKLGVRNWFVDNVFVAGLFGVIPGAVCSWLSGKRGELTQAN
jgi:hypothetical protein